MRRKWYGLGVALVTLLLVCSFVALPATSPRFRVGEAIQFRVDDASTWFWGCCGCCECEDTLILGWRIVTTAEQVVYSVVHDAPVSASTWSGSWAQADSAGTAVPAGQYKLYVDTSVGTLSRCFVVYDPCSCCWYSPCVTCACTDLPSIAGCACRTSLVFVDDCRTGCFFPFFWGWGCCGCSSCP